MGLFSWLKAKFSRTPERGNAERATQRPRARPQLGRRDPHADKLAPNNCYITGVDKKSLPAFYAGEVSQFAVHLITRKGEQYAQLNERDFSARIRYAEGHAGRGGEQGEAGVEVVPEFLFPSPPALGENGLPIITPVTGVPIVRFTARRAGMYEITAIVRDGVTNIMTTLPHCPFRVTVSPGRVDPLTTSLEGMMEGKGATGAPQAKEGSLGTTVLLPQGVERMFLIQSRDGCSNNLTKGGLNSMFKIKCTHHTKKDGAEAASAKSADTVFVARTVDFDDGRYGLCVEIFSPGLYDLAVYLKDQIISKGKLTVAVLAEEELRVVEAQTGTKQSFRVQRLKGSRWKSSVLELTAKTITLKKQKLIGYAKMFTTPLNRRILVTMKGDNELVFEIGSFSPITISTEQRNIIFGVMLRAIEKRRADVGATFADRRVSLQSELGRGQRGRKHAVSVRRFSLLQDSLALFRKTGAKDWKRLWSITFVGEEGLDYGGLVREYFSLLARALLSSDVNGLRLFTPVAKEDPTSALHFTHFLTLEAERRRLGKTEVEVEEMYRLAGRVVGKALFDSLVHDSHHLLEVRLSRSIYKLILGFPITYHDFQTDDPSLYKSKIMYILGNNYDESGLALDFTDEVNREQEDGSTVHDGMVLLCPNGNKREVTEESKTEYLQLLARSRLMQSARPWKVGAGSKYVKAFVEGVYDLLPETLADFVDEADLELLTCGQSRIDVEDFKMHTKVVHFDFNRHVPDWFWTCVKNMTQEERARLVHFVCGSSVLPAGGFSKIDPPFNITPGANPRSLPVAHTCFHQLELPLYKSYSELESRLLLAIREGAEGFGSA
uniref:HECT-type E3 ubiquitin transferase n=1 Tax=Palpitomonas bilix TaxID=652834 RepID=A0A7S3GKY6_9EUKA|mmetsp:Transcript_804/g.1458  ORF Transcript_804/g.1458 Transcript_804/m.1458 type:complete len:834 (+) Transcript_804:109-2610(+)